MEKDFEFEINKINLIYLKARQSFEIFKYLSRQDINSDSFWVQIMYLSFKDTIIELDKLFSLKNNQHYRIKKLFNKLKKTGQYKNCDFNTTIIMHWENELLRFSSILQTISNLRDKHFAHTDKIDNIENNTTSIDYRNLLNDSDVETLFDFIKKVMIEILNQCKNEHLDLELFFYEGDINIFKQLFDLKSYREIETNRKLNEYKKPSV